jgi:hypothetical protein
MYVVCADVSQLNRREYFSTLGGRLDDLHAVDLLPVTPDFSVWTRNLPAIHTDAWVLRTCQRFSVTLLLVKNTLAIPLSVTQPVSSRGRIYNTTRKKRRRACKASLWLQLQHQAGATVVGDNKFNRWRTKRFHDFHPNWHLSTRVFTFFGLYSHECNGLTLCRGSVY